MIECIRCGACCFGETPRYVRVTGDDHARLDDDTLVEWIGNEAYMRMTQTHGVGHCAALVPSAEGTFLCSVYDRRPQICRDLERGSPQCQGERVTKEGRARRLLTLLA
ncbi:MAG: YkgJ family cysteine cluster protein [Labilithrix sp.]|nr:YkgJ family cysteine cluster protein [Labilithrix sp.]MCW5816725.1 YkgJ family cysteine cluster protein [Labilithrix sp.]